MLCNEASAPQQQFLYTENQHFALVDALPYIDTQLVQPEVASQVQALIDEEMKNFEPRDYLASLPLPELPLINSERMTKEFERIVDKRPMGSIDSTRYNVEAPQGFWTQDSDAWRQSTAKIHMQSEYNRLRLINLELMERFGAKGWVAHSQLLRAAEGAQAKIASTLRAEREDVNKMRKLDQMSCGNELRKLNLELEQFTRDNNETDAAVWELEAKVKRLRAAAVERNVLPIDHCLVSDGNGTALPAPTQTILAEQDFICKNLGVARVEAPCGAITEESAKNSSAAVPSSDGPANMDLS